MVYFVDLLNLLFHRILSVIPVELPEGKSGQQAHLVEKLQKRAELMGAQKTGNWFVNCETYQAVATFSKCFLCSLAHSLMP